jgi:hypothetical protein
MRNEFYVTSTTPYKISLSEKYREHSDIKISMRWLRNLKPLGELSSVRYTVTYVDYVSKVNNILVQVMEFY